MTIRPISTLAAPPAAIPNPIADQPDRSTSAIPRLAAEHLAASRQVALARRHAALTRRQAALTRLHALYQAALSPWLHSLGLVPGGCRFQPTCSQYATLAIAQHGWLPGLTLSVARLLRCHPFARGGWDPVPGLATLPGHTGALAASTIDVTDSDVADSTHDPA